MPSRIPKKRPVIALNASFEVMGPIKFNTAVKKIVANDAYVLAADPEQFVQGPPTPDGGRFKIPWPLIIVHNEYVYIDYSEIEPPDDILAARMAILKRDNFTCMYCGEVGSTYDHILPQSRGGQNTYLNLVAACVGCNGLKADRTPEEAGMKLIREPFVPNHDRYASEQRRVWKMLESGTLTDLPEDV